MIETNWIAVLVAAASSMVIGFLWYGPLFGKTWMKLVGLTKSDIDKDAKNLPLNYAAMYISAFVTAYVLDFTISMGESILERSAVSGLTAAFWVWLGFVAAVKLSDVIFNKKPWKLYFLETGYYLAFFLTAGFILGNWA